MLVDSRIELLNNTRVFEGLDLEQIQKIIDVAEERDVPAGEVIMREGANEDTLWIVETGEVEVYKLIQGSVEHTLAFVPPGDVLGELELVVVGPRAASARTAKPSKFLVISRLAFERATGEDPLLAALFYRNVAATIAERLRATNELYRDSVSRGFESVGASTLSLHKLAENLDTVGVHTQSGLTVRGRLLQVDRHDAGHSLVVKDDTSGKITLVPYHAVQTLELG